jgi:hypothetical protein
VGRKSSATLTTGFVLWMRERTSAYANGDTPPEYGLEVHNGRVTVEREGAGARDLDVH